MTLRSVLLLALLTTTPLGAGPLRWSGWRGANDAGCAADGTYPARLDDAALRWQVELPGKGCSTPIVWDGTIILTTPLGDQDGVMAVDWDGGKLWETAVGPARDGRHRNGSSSNPSAITDDGNHIVIFMS